MIIIQIEIKEVTPGNVAMQARGGHAGGHTTDEEVKAADKIMIGVESLFRSIGTYTDVRPLTIITKDVPPKSDEPSADAQS